MRLLKLYTRKLTALISILFFPCYMFSQSSLCEQGYNEVEIIVGGGSWDSEISWNIEGTVFSGFAGTYNICLNSGCYDFKMNDSYGDGWNGATVTIDNASSMSNNTLGYGSSGTFSFSINTNIICAENNTFCDGEWVEDIVSYNCGSFTSSGSAVCNSQLGCYWDGYFYIESHYSCYGGEQVTNNSYCDGQLTPILFGCTEEDAINFNSNANQDDGSCILCDGEWEEVTNVYNCSSFSNQLSCENIEDCSWESWWVVGDSYGGSFSNGCGGGEGTATNIYCDGELVILGCTDSEFVEYNPEANTDDGSCDILAVYGCNNPNYLEYNPDVNIYDGSCVTYNVYGCLDSSALNFNNDANIDDGSCTYTEVFAGCTDIDAMNYNSSANIDDGSCLFDNTSDCQNIYITLNNGWNMIGFSCSMNTDAGITFGPIQDKIVIAKDAVGNAYLPSWEFNGIGDLERGYGYLLKVSEEINNYSICEQ